MPWAIANASYKQQNDNEGVTEIVEIPNRGHALTIDSGWREVADTALKFVAALRLDGRFCGRRARMCVARGCRAVHAGGG